eukprot:CAMPEP_0185901002 /NCGR_PEP_ID=MMETSP0196C-20130402/420_1 /TAXON_ID=2932 /ORGANISM="Alexandrium fundyense, Strain CCMP1719" /LENGTH=110 /DNA_ID=CAMNT_0028619575 /DNA_START=36 /DNA_END=368 /DNA_ORIENTATION=+
MHDGSISAVAEIEQLVEKASDGSLYIINERMLCQFPCAAKLKAIKHLSGNTSCTSGADSSTEAPGEARTEDLRNHEEGKASKRARTIEAMCAPDTARNYIGFKVPPRTHA